MTDLRVGYQVRERDAILNRFQSFFSFFICLIGFTFVGIEICDLFNFFDKLHEIISLIQYNLRKVLDILFVVRLTLRDKLQIRFDVLRNSIENGLKHINIVIVKFIFFCFVFTRKTELIKLINERLKFRFQFLQVFANSFFHCRSCTSVVKKFLHT